MDSITQLRGNFFLTRLKRKDPSYISRLTQRYRKLIRNSERYAQFSEQEMFNAYLELMEISLHLNQSVQG